MDQSAQASNAPEGQRAEPQAQATPSTAPTTQMESAAQDTSRNQGAERGGRRNKRKDLGRKAWSREIADKRTRNAEQQAAKRRKAEDGETSIPIYATQFSKEEIDAEQRRPKKKVAVLMSYSGTGYHGMQLTDDMKTIEGELFSAFVAAGAISKWNAMDPKKSSLVRCARTDKGVHAGGNVVSLKLIIEDPDVVKKINENLSSQIRVWGIEVTNKSFSAYHMCDSRIYEYLIPTHCFIPPHPSTFLAKKLKEIAEEKGDLENYNRRQADMEGYWDKIDDEFIKPILERLPEDVRQDVQDALCIKDEKTSISTEEQKPGNDSSETQPRRESAETETEPKTESTEEESSKGKKPDARTLSITAAIKEIRAAYFKAKKTFRIPPERVQRVNETLAQYIGTRNYHNYTIQKAYNDPSSKRHIKSFKVAADPIIINGTEWLSLKVHGQSFMMHQIRKMVAMVALIVRCGTDSELIKQSYEADRIPIPKAPGLGLLLERPIFDVYNNKAATQFSKEPIDFSKYEEEIREFKQREIYERIFREEEETNTFGNFFNHIDSFRHNTFLYVTSGGIPASKDEQAAKDTSEADKAALAEIESEAEDEVVNGGEEGG